MRAFPTHAGYTVPHLSPTAASIDDDTALYYDYWKQHYVDGGLIPSGGEGYAMLITVLMAGHDPDARTQFDALRETAQDTSSFEAAADQAFSLLLANRQWGSDGTVDYGTEARIKIRAIEQSMIDQQTALPLGSDDLQLSDIIPDHFSAFSSFTSDTLWDRVTDESKQVIRSLASGPSRLTGLVPATVTFDSNGRVIPLSGDQGAFSTRAASYPLHIGIAALTSDDSFWIDQLLKGSHWAAAITEGDPLALHDGYLLDGKPIDPGSGFSVRFGGPFAVAAMLNLDQQAWLDALYAAIRTTHEGYEEDSTALLSLIVLGGNWWEP